MKNLLLATAITVTSPVHSYAMSALEAWNFYRGTLKDHYTAYLMDSTIHIYRDFSLFEDAMAKQAAFRHGKSSTIKNHTAWYGVTSNGTEWHMRCDETTWYAVKGKHSSDENYDYDIKSVEKCVQIEDGSHWERTIDYVDDTVTIESVPLHRVE